jgi:hypothetical protein
MKTALIDSKTLEEIAIGSEVTDFRGDKWILKGWYEKPFPSTGRVQVTKNEDGWTQEFYPSVINASIVERKDK